jgi:endonuclease V-like protein UPF0215 family
MPDDKGLEIGEWVDFYMDGSVQLDGDFDLEDIKKIYEKMKELQVEEE